MLPTEAQASHPRGFFYEGSLPYFVDDKQPPQTKRPFTTISKTAWAHTVNLLLPVDCVNAFQDELQSRSANFTYAKVILSLGQILNGEFFTHYIKRGNISMLSEGRRGVDNMFSLHDGVLRLEMDRPTYERAGLVGSVISNHESQHRKTRYEVTFNLRLPSMLHGKKGFEKLVWASKHVINSSMTWLFFNHDPFKIGSKDEPISTHHPIWLSNKSNLLARKNTVIPQGLEQMMQSETRQQLATDNEFVIELEEWLSLAMIGSPRVGSGDNIDPYLCRYDLPGTAWLDHDTQRSTLDLICLQWHGFMPSNCIFTIFLAVLKSVHTKWAALSINSFNEESYTILQLPQEKGSTIYLEWDRILRH